ncbi:MAG: Ig domain-containing protein [Byssovorax sp.]
MILVPPPLRAPLATIASVLATIASGWQRLPEAGGGGRALAFGTIERTQKRAGISTRFGIQSAPNIKRSAPLGAWHIRCCIPRQTALHGNLPPGLALDSFTGKLPGTPTQAGTYGMTVQVDDSGTSAPLVKSVNVVVS